MATCACLLLAACGSKKNDAADEAPAKTPVAAAPTSDAAPAKPKAPPIPEAELSKLVDSWVAAQNKGDFDGYAALYDPSMTGILRVGDKEKKLDHAGWLKSRKRMFRSGFTVRIEDLAIRTSPDRAEATFIQNFRTNSGRFSDRGPKRLVISKTAAGLRIVYEEMLQSVVGADAQPLGKGTVTSVPRNIRREYGNLVWGRGQSLEDGSKAQFVVLEKQPDEDYVGLDENTTMTYALIQDGKVTDSAESEVGSATRWLLPAIDVDGDAIADTVLLVEERETVSEAAAHGVDYEYTRLIIAGSKSGFIFDAVLAERASRTYFRVGETLEHYCFFDVARGPAVLAVFRLDDVAEEDQDDMLRPASRVYRWGSANNDATGGRAAWGYVAESLPARAPEKARQAALARAGGGKLPVGGTLCTSIGLHADSGYRALTGLSPSAEGARQLAAKAGKKDATIVELGGAKEPGWTPEAIDGYGNDYDENTQ